MDKREKLKESFKRSKAKVKSWESSFFSEHQRKPTKEEMKTAPEQIQICYKNCWKIKSYFESEQSEKENEVLDETSQTVDLSTAISPEDSIISGKKNSFAGVLDDPQNMKPKATSPVEEKKPPLVLKSASGVWGSHLNKKPTAKQSDSFSNSFSEMSYKFGLDTSQVATVKTRTSLKKRTRTFQSFTDTLGPTTTPELSNTSASQPIVSFTPEDQNSLGSTDLLPVAPVSSAPGDEKKCEEREEEEEDDSLTLFPALSVKQSESAGPKAVGAVKQGGLTRKIDGDWLARCTGIQGEAGDTGLGEKVDQPCEPPVPLHTSINQPKEAVEADKRGDVIQPGHVQDKLDVDVRSVKESDETISKQEPIVKKNMKNSKKRKRNYESDEEEDFQQSEDEEEEAVKVKVKQRKSRSSKAVAKGGAKPRKKRAKVTEEEQEEVREKTDEPQGPSAINMFALGFEEQEEDKVVAVKRGQSAQERLESKVLSGKANDCFVKIDLKKKKFARGQAGTSGAKIKRAEWKRKMDLKEGRKVKEMKCFRCGETGHWARQCTGGKGDSLIPVDMAEEFDAGEFPSLEQARDMASGVLKLQKENSGMNSLKLFSVKKTESSSIDEGTAPDPELIMDIDSQDDALLLEAAKQFDCAESEMTAVQEKYRVPPLDVDAADIKAALAKFGYSGFRAGQEETITRILAGKSSLALLATGTGKSLIYQLPAYMYRERSACITLVVSPLVSLMEDQVSGLPSFLKAAALHYNMTATQKEKVVESVKSGKLHFLLVSPESLAGGGGMFGSLLPSLPPIAFVCIDEAHCVSHWSHNFRPSYLRLCRIIRDKLGVATILGLTATAPESLTRSVASRLGVAMEDVVRGPLLPGNLTLTVSRDTDRDRALLEMLGEAGSLGECESVIVYCTRREECERLATHIRTHLQTRDIRPGKSKLSCTAEPYHAGLSAYKRKTVQAAFMSGKLRVVVATVAFGMGIDKSDIRAIVHHNMPRSFESYIQEIGRAGRDGLPARCHLFLDCRGGDVRELKRHIFGNSVDRFTLRTFLSAALGRLQNSERTSEYQEVAASVVSLVEELDLPEENISTLLCYLEDYSPPLVRVSNHVYCQAKVQCYGGPRQLRQVAARCPPLAAAIAILRQKGADLEAASSVEFHVVEVSARMGWDSAIVKKELKNLEWTCGLTGWKKSGVIVEFSDLGFHFHAKTGLSEQEMDSVLEDLYKKVETRERTELWGLVRLGKAFSLVSWDQETQAGGEQEQERSDKLKLFIREYFTETEREVPDKLPPSEPCQAEDSVRADIRAFVCTHSEHTWSGRAVARIFHGIQSPNFQAKQWGRVFRFWRKHLDTDFNLLVRFATEEILNLKRGAK